MWNGSLGKMERWGALLMSKKIVDAVQARVEKEAAILAKKKAEKLASDIRKSSDIEIRKLAISDEDLLGYLNENIAGAAKLYCRLHRGSVVFVKYWERFLIWNKHHWEEDDYDVAYQLTEDICELYMRLADKYQVLADEAGNKNESAAYQRITDTAMRKVSSFRDPTGQEKIIKMIRRIRNPLIALPKHFDIRHYEKAAPNGVIDLRTGSLREGRPEDYMLKHIVTEYDTALFTDVVEHGTDPCPVSNAYLLSSMDGNAEVVEFIWRLLGWGLITERLDHKFIIFWGEHGRNGKDTLIKLVTETLGLELSGDANVEMLLQQQQSKNSSAPSPDIMALRGMSLAWFNEAEENQSFAMAKLKKLTGGGYITARGLQDKLQTTWKQTHLSIMATNELPRAKADDAAFWQRALIIKWPLSFVDDPKENYERPADKDLEKKLMAEKKGVLVRLVLGAMQYLLIGLAVPDVVKGWVNEQRDNIDELGQFIKDWCIFEPRTEDIAAYTMKVRASDLYDAFCIWYSANKDKKRVISPRVFGEMCSKKDIPKKQSNGIWRLGITLTEQAWDELEEFRASKASSKSFQ